MQRKIGGEGKEGEGRGEEGREGVEGRGREGRGGRGGEGRGGEGREGRGGEGKEQEGRGVEGVERGGAVTSDDAVEDGCWSMIIGQIEMFCPTSWLTRCSVIGALQSDSVSATIKGLTTVNQTAFITSAKYPYIVQGNHFQRAVTEGLIYVYHSMKEQYSVYMYIHTIHTYYYIMCTMN